MKKKTFKHEKGLVQRWLARLLIFLMAMSFLGCVAAIPVVIYYEAEKHYTATVQVDAKAADVYNTAVRLIGEKPDVKIKKKDDAKFLVEIERGKQYASIKAVSHNGNKTQLVVTADASKKKEEDKELALRIVKDICDELGVKYKVVKG